MGLTCNLSTSEPKAERLPKSEDSLDRRASKPGLDQGLNLFPSPPNKISEILLNNASTLKTMSYFCVSENTHMKRPSLALWMAALPVQSMRPEPSSQSKERTDWKQE